MNKKNLMKVLIVFAFALGITATNAQDANKDWKPLEPMDSGSKTVGAVGSLPGGVKYNEFNGAVYIDLSTGLKGLMIPIHYNQMPANQLKYLGLTAGQEDEISGNIGSFWNLGYGWLQVKRPVTETVECASYSDRDEPCSLAGGYVLYGSEDGSTVDFTRDYLFQNVEESDRSIAKDIHFIDSSLRRVTTVPASVNEFTQHPYYMLKPNGTKIKFEPLYSLSNNHSLNYMRFLPTKIEKATGDYIEIDYVDGLYRSLPESFGLSGIPTREELMAIDFYRAYVSKVRDNEGRYVEVKYKDIILNGVNRKALESVSYGPEKNLLVTYQSGVQTVGEKPHLLIHEVKTALGYYSKYKYMPGLSEVNSKVPLLHEVVTDNGGKSVIEYKANEVHFCQIQSFRENPPGMLSKKTKQSIAKAYHISPSGDVIGHNFSFWQDYGHNRTDDVVLDVNVIGMEGEFSYTNRYIGEPINLGQMDICANCCQGNIKQGPLGSIVIGDGSALVGKRKSKVSRYLNPLGEYTELHEKWFYAKDTEFEGGNNILPVLSNGNVSIARISEDRGLQQLSPLRQYSSKLKNSDTWENIAYEYDTSEYDFAAGTPDFLTSNMSSPVKIIMWRNKGLKPNFVYDEHRVEQYFSNQHRLEYPVTADTNASDDEYVLGLLKEASSSYFGYNGQNELREFYLAGNKINYHPEFPQSILTQNELVEGSYINEYVDYYDSSDSGLVKGVEPYGRIKSKYKADFKYSNLFEDYKYGEALKFYDSSSLNSPNSQANITKVLNYNGSVASITQDGIKMNHFYDLDGRNIKTVSESGLTTEIEYSPPGTYPGWKKEYLNGVLQTETYNNSWGQITKTVTYLTPTQKSETLYHYDKAGHNTGTTSPLGGTQQVFIDVKGRTTAVINRDDSCENLFECPIVNSNTYKYEYLDPYNYEKTTVVKYENGTEYKVQNTSVNNYIGKPVLASSAKLDLNENTIGNENKTVINYDYRVSTEDRRFEKFHIEEILPYGDPELKRVKATDLLGNIRWERNPEIISSDVPFDLAKTQIRYKYDYSTGLLTQEVGPNGSYSYLYHYDDEFRLTKQWDAFDNSQPLIENFFDEKNRLYKSIARESGKEVVKETLEFDEMNRPVKVKTTVPDVPPPVTDLWPDTYWLLGPTLDLNWDPNSADHYTVLLRQGDAQPLKFEWLANDDLRITPEKLSNAITSLSASSPEDALKYQNDLGNNSLLKGDHGYMWKVLSESDSGFPIFPSEWIPLTKPIDPSDCHIGFFNVEDGLNEGALVEWEARNCDKTQHVLQVFASTMKDADVVDACKFDDAEYSGNMVGRERALFMLNGYDMEDGKPVFAANPSSPQCPGANSAEFWAVLKDITSGAVLHEWPRRTGKVRTGDVCSLRNVNVIHGLSGRAPIISWYAENCGNNTLEVLVDSEYNAERPECLLEKWHWTDAEAQGLDGQIRAHFMTDGYLVNDGVACPSIEKASLLVRILDEAQNVVERYPFDVFAHPDDSQCRTRIFNGGSAPGIAPLVEWETINCDAYDVRVTRTSVGKVADSQCFLHKDVWSTNKTGPKFATFMTEGFDRIGTYCEPQYEVDFTIEVVDPETGFRVNENDSYHTLRVQTKALEYSDSEQCEILNYGVFDGYANSSPMVSWSTSPGCAGGVVDLKVSSLHPSTAEGLDPVCQLDSTTWLSQHNGPAALEFATVGYDPNFVDDGVAGYRCPKSTSGEVTPINEYEVWVEVRDSQGRLVTQTDKKLVYYEPHLNSNTDGYCSITPDSFEIISQGGGDNVPVINWQTDCEVGGRYAVNLLASSLSGNDYNPQPNRELFEIAGSPVNITLPELCGFQKVNFAGDTMGPRPAYFLRNGYHSYRENHQDICNTHSAKFQLVVTDTVTGSVIEATDPLVVTYFGDYLRDPLVENCFQDSCHELEADSDGTVSEPPPGSDNGVDDSGTTTIVAGVDLVISELTVSNAEPLQGEQVTVNWKVRNNGNQMASSTDVHFQLKGYSSELHAMTGNLGPQQEVSMSKTVTIPDDWKSTQTIYVKVNHLNGINESSYGNNLAFIYLKVREILPDIEAGLIGVTRVGHIVFKKPMSCWDRENPIDVVAGVSVYMHTALTNKGLDTVPPISQSDRFFGYNLTAAHAISDYVQYFDLDAIDINENLLRPLEYIVPDFLPVGTKIKLIYSSDYKNTLDEMNELNNSSVCYLRVSY